MDEIYAGYAAAMGTALCWTITALSFEYSSNKIGSYAVNIIRLVLGLLISMIAAWIFRGLILPFDAPAHTWNILLLSGVIGFALGDLFLFQAFVEVGARVAMLVYSVVPLLAAMLGFFFLGETLTLMEGLGIAVTVTGIALVVFFKEPGKFAFKHSFKGILLAFLGALGQAVGFVLSKYGMEDFDAFASNQIRMIGGIITFIILYSFIGKWKEVFAAFKQPKVLAVVSNGAVFGPFLGVGLSMIAVQLSPVGVASTIIALVPVLIILPSLIFFHEKVYPVEIFGAVLSFIGVALLFA
jgi:drug/metabolite transporter (DMT)-like permease